jgi:hypothetical protein
MQTKGYIFHFLREMTRTVLMNRQLEIYSDKLYIKEKVVYIIQALEETKGWRFTVDIHFT